MSVKIIFGTAGMPSLQGDAADKQISVLHEYGVKDLDTASLYVCAPNNHRRALTYSQAGSEALLGRTGASKDFIVHTKAPGFTSGSLSRQSIKNGMEKSLEDLKLASVGELMPSLSVASLIPPGRDIFSPLSRPGHANRRDPRGNSRAIRCWQISQSGCIGAVVAQED